jgi:hypothetical protein
VNWAQGTHKAAQTVWNLVPENKQLDDSYYDQVLPVLDRQLGLGGLRSYVRANIGLLRKDQQ